MWIWRNSFDRVNHDILMERISRRVEDKAVLWLIRGYLVAGILDGGVVMERYEGTPQGGPLSPLLANVLLDEVDRELEKRGHRFVRYADDCNVYVRSGRSGERVLKGLRKLYDRLHLKVNEAKTAVAQATGNDDVSGAESAGRLGDGRPGGGREQPLLVA
jgi:retron-type reverse transcriptase